MERAEVTRVSLPGQPDSFNVVLSYEGQPLELPAASEEEAQAALAVLSAKARQVAGDPDWGSGLLELQPEWLDYIAGCTFKKLVEALASGAEVGMAEGGSPGTLDQPPQLMKQDGRAAWKPADAPAAGLGEDMGGAQEHGTAAEEEEGAPPIRARHQRRTGAHNPAGSTGVHGVHRKQGGRLGMEMASDWGRLSLTVPDIKTGARLYDTALIWRTIRQVEGAHVAADGKPWAGGSLPAFRAEDLPPKMNNPVGNYTMDSELMDFLSKASFQELWGRLQKEAKEALGGPDEFTSNGSSSDGEEGTATAERQPSRGWKRRGGSQLPHGVRQNKREGTIYVRLTTGYGTLNVSSVETAAQGARLYDIGRIWSRMRKRKGTQCDSQGRPAASGGQPLPPLEPGERPGLLNSPLESYLADHSLMEFLGTAGVDELKARMKQEIKSARGAQDPGPEAHQAGRGGAQEPGTAIPAPPPARRTARRPASGKDSTKTAAPGRPNKRAKHGPSRPANNPGGRAAAEPASAAGQSPGAGPPVATGMGATPTAPAAPAVSPPTPTPLQMISQLQPLLEACSVDEALLLQLEVRFPQLAEGEQMYLHKALLRATKFGDRGSAEQLMRNVLRG